MQEHEQRQFGRCRFGARNRDQRPARRFESVRQDGVELEEASRLRPSRGRNGHGRKESPEFQQTTTRRHQHRREQRVALAESGLLPTSASTGCQQQYAPKFPLQNRSGADFVTSTSAELRERPRWLRSSTFFSRAEHPVATALQLPRGGRRRCAPRRISLPLVRCRRIFRDENGRLGHSLSPMRNARLCLLLSASLVPATLVNCNADEGGEARLASGAGGMNVPAGIGGRGGGASGAGPATASGGATTPSGTGGNAPASSGGKTMTGSSGGQAMTGSGGLAMTAGSGGRATTEGGAAAGGRPAAGGSPAVGGGGRGGSAANPSGGTAGKGGGGGSAGSGPLPSNITIWIAGDSTVANGSTPCPVGWGAEFDALFDERVKVTNSAVGGRSVRTWLYNVQTTMDASGECNLATDASGEPTLQARWQAMLNASTGMKPGDYLFIQFGINDGSATCDRHVGLEAFKESFGMMAEAAKERGAQPIFVTPLSAIACSGNAARGTRGAFVTTTQEAGEQFDVPVIDLHALSVALYDSLGFCPLVGGDVSASTTGPVGDFFCDDHTHVDRPGAVQIAKLVAGELRAQGLPLAGYLK